MSWEVISVNVDPCACGAGTIETTVEMDDWNRIRKSTAIHCSVCRCEQEKLQKQRDANSRERARLLEEAQSLALERYFATWRSPVEGNSKKAIWRYCTGGEGYPSLETFYKHVRDEGIETWLRRWFKNNISGALKQIGVEDEEIFDLLALREQVPEYREPHPWQ